MQHQYQWRMGLVRAMPVQVDEVAVSQPQSFAVTLQLRQLAPEWPPQGLQVGIGQADGRTECGVGAGHAGWLMMCLASLPRNSAAVPAPLVGVKVQLQAWHRWGVATHYTPPGG
ncbi:hypothetical protein D3C76_1358090 [compost metagenome]